MRQTLSIVAVLVLLGSPLVRAQDDPKEKPEAKSAIHWIPDLRRAKEEAPGHDVPIFVFVYRSNESDAVKLEKDVFSDPRFRKLSHFFLMVRAEARRDEEILKPYEIKRYPTLLYLDSAGELLFSLDEGLDAKQVLNYMGRSFLISLFNSGVRSKERGDVREAMRKFQTLLMLSRGTPAHDWAEREIRHISTDAVKMLSQSKIALDKEDYTTAMELLDQLVYEYRDTETYAEAKELYETLAKDRRAVEALHKVIAEARAERMLERAQALEKDKELEDALILYWDITRNVPGTAAEKRAAERAKELAADRALALRAARTRMNRDCRQWLEMGWNFEKNNERAKALAYYQKVIEYYAGTSYAKRAQEAIDKLMKPATSD